MYQLVDCDFVVNWMRYLRLKLACNFFIRSIRFTYELLDKITCVFTILIEYRFDRYTDCLFSLTFEQNLILE